MEHKRSLHDRVHKSPYCTIRVNCHVLGYIRTETNHATLILELLEGKFRHEDKMTASL